MERKHKTTLLLDPEVWRQFQEEVLRHEGGRAASGEVEKLLRGSSPEPFAEALGEVSPRRREGFPSLEEVERRRPRPRQPAAALVREERDERETRVSGLERGGQALRRRRRK